MLFVICSAAILLQGFLQRPDIVVSRVSIHLICWFTLGITGLGTLAFAALFVPGVTNGSWVRWLEQQPWVGQLLARLVGAIGVYRHHRGVLALAVLMTLGVHSLYTLGIYLMTRGLYDPYPPLSLQFVDAPLAAATGVIPLFAGPFEAALDLLYVLVPLSGGVHMVAGQGLVVALGYRIATLVTAAVGMVYYFSAAGVRRSPPRGRSGGRRRTSGRGSPLGRWSMPCNRGRRVGPGRLGGRRPTGTRTSGGPALANASLSHPTCFHPPLMPRCDPVMLKHNLQVSRGPLLRRPDAASGIWHYRRP